MQIRLKIRDYMGELLLDTVHETVNGVGIAQTWKTPLLPTTAQKLIVIQVTATEEEACTNDGSGSNGGQSTTPVTQSCGTGFCPRQAHSHSSQQVSSITEDEWNSVVRSYD